MLLPSNDGIKHSQCHCRHQCRAHNGAILDPLSRPSEHSNDVTSPPSYSQSSTNSPPSSSVSTSSSIIALGFYIFKAISPTITCLLPKSGMGPAIYHILTEKLAISQITLITIRKGPPDGNGDIVATFELDGRDSIIIAKKRFCRSKCFSSKMTNSSQCPRQLFCEFGGYQERWTRDLTMPRRRVVLCRGIPGSPHSKRPLARLWLADKMRALWNATTFLQDPELEIFHLEGLDERITSVVLMVLEQQEKVNDLFTGRTMTGLLSNHTHTTPAAFVTNAHD